MSINILIKLTILATWLVSSAWVWNERGMIEGLVFVIVTGIGLFIFWFWQCLWEEHKHDRGIK